jgi:hypothetical protein
MRRPTIAVLALVSMTTAVAAESPRQAFVKAWKGQPVVVKATLYSLVYNERGTLGNMRRGLRDGLLVVTSGSGSHLQFDGRQGRETVTSADAAALIKGVSTAYQGDALDVRSYRRLEPVAIEQFVPGAELVVRDVHVESDVVTLELLPADGSKDTMTSLRVKWPMPLSSSFNERAQLDAIVRRFLAVRRPAD